jgi:hypothetical protein
MDRVDDKVRSFIEEYYVSKVSYLNLEEKVNELKADNKKFTWLILSSVVLGIMDLLIRSKVHG